MHELTEEEWAEVQSMSAREISERFNIGLSGAYRWLSGARRPVVKSKPVVRYYGPIKVEWTPQEASRLDAIKQAKMEDRLADITSP